MRLFAIVALIATLFVVSATARFHSSLHHTKHAPSPYTSQSPTFHSGPPYVNMTAAELRQVWTQNPKQFYIVDVREQDEYETAHIPGAHSFPLSTLEKEFKKLPETKQIYIHCAGGVRSIRAINLLISLGYQGQMTNISDGFNAWTGPTESGPEISNLQAYVEALYAMNLAQRPGMEKKSQQQKKTEDVNQLLAKIVGF